MINKGLGLAAVVIGLWGLGACATGSDGFVQEETGGSDSAGAGGAGGVNGAGGMNGTGGNTSASSSSGASSSSSASSGGGSCGANQHSCNGVCELNTPDTGCVTSVSCAPCPTVPNGVSICTAQGTCDVSCGSGYVKNGGTCVCSYQAPNCCTDAECTGGQTCLSGTCSGGGGGSDGGVCNPFACVFDCAFQGLDCLDPFTCTCG